MRCFFINEVNDKKCQYSAIQGLFFKTSKYIHASIQAFVLEIQFNFMVYMCQYSILLCRYHQLQMSQAEKSPKTSDTRSIKYDHQTTYFYENKNLTTRY